MAFVVCLAESNVVAGEGIKPTQGGLHDTAGVKTFGGGGAERRCSLRSTSAEGEQTSDSKGYQSRTSPRFTHRDAAGKDRHFLSLSPKNCRFSAISIPQMGKVPVSPAGTLVSYTHSRIHAHM